MCFLIVLGLTHFGQLFVTHFLICHRCGKFVGAGSKISRVGMYAEEAEACALFWALKVAKVKGWCNILVEGNCKNIIDALNEGGKRCFHIQSIIDNCLFLEQYFGFVSFQFCYRECKSGSHRLASLVVFDVCNEVWVDVPAVWLMDVLYFDVSHPNA